jgi:hypothetical protein
MVGKPYLGICPSCIPNLPCALIPPNSPSDGVRVAFIVQNGAPIELLEFTDPNHPARRQQSKMLI